MALQGAGHGAQHPIADLVAMGVVDQLEVVEVEQHATQRGSVGQRILPGPRQELVQRAAIGQAGELVAVGRLAQPGVEGRQLALAPMGLRALALEGTDHAHHTHARAQLGGHHGRRHRSRQHIVGPGAQRLQQPVAIQAVPEQQQVQARAVVLAQLPAKLHRLDGKLVGVEHHGFRQAAARALETRFQVRFEQHVETLGTQGLHEVRATAGQGPGQQHAGRLRRVLGRGPAQGGAQALKLLLRMALRYAQVQHPGEFREVLADLVEQAQQHRLVQSKTKRGHPEIGQVLQAALPVQRGRQAATDPHHGRQLGLGLLRLRQGQQRQPQALREIPGLQQGGAGLALVEAPAAALPTRQVLPGLGISQRLRAQGRQHAQLSDLGQQSQAEGLRHGQGVAPACQLLQQQRARQRAPPVGLELEPAQAGAVTVHQAQPHRQPGQRGHADAHHRVLQRHGGPQARVQRRVGQAHGLSHQHRVALGDAADLEHAHVTPLDQAHQLQRHRVRRGKRLPAVSQGGENPGIARGDVLELEHRFEPW